jgi:pimeloyl-ACP methyl ester carboxylesterase
MTAAYSEPRTIEANGVALCCDTFGDRSRPPLVLIMGLGAQMISWDDAFCAGLADRGLYVVRFDNRDVGKSTWLGQLEVPNIAALMARAAVGLRVSVPYTLKDMAQDTLALCDAFGLDRVSVMGASMGGAIAQEIAIGHPERLSTLISLYSTTGAATLPPPTADAMRILMSKAPTTRDAYIAHHKNVLRVLRGPNFTEEEAQDEARAGRNFDRGINPAGTARQLAAIIASGNRTKALANVRTPTLVVHGDADPLIHVAAGRATARAIPGARLEILPGVGHGQPRAVWPHLIDLIASHVLAHTSGVQS